MPFQPAPQCAEAVILATSNGKTVANVLNFSFGATYSAADVTNLSTAVGAVVLSDYPPLASGNVTFDLVKAKGLANINDFEATYTLSSTPGTVGVKPLPANVACCITLRTALTGRSARGRFYAFPTGSNNLDTSPDQFISTYPPAVRTMLLNIRTAAAAQGWAMCVLSRFTAKAARTSAVPFVITNVEARNTTVDSQRGRLPVNH